MLLHAKTLMIEEKVFVVYIWGYGSMKTALKTLVILFAMFCAMPIFACPSQSGDVTGGACSVKDIKKLENERMGQGMQEGVNFNLRGLNGEKNLRPVKINPEIKNPSEESCIFCMQKAIFGE